MTSSGVYVDPLAWVAESATLGQDTKVWSFTRVLDHAVIGAHCQLGQNVFVDRGVRLGNRVKVQNNVSVYSGVTIGDGVFLGPSCVFTNVMFPRAFVERKAEFLPTPVARGVTVGANATVVCGVRLAQFALIGAGAVIAADVPAFGLMVGVPARRIGWACACGERLPTPVENTSQCRRCRLVYEMQATTCSPRDHAAFETWWQACMAPWAADSVAPTRRA